MKFDWRLLRERLLQFLEFLTYFLITIVVLGSLGVWIPFAIDKAQNDCINENTWNDLPWNLTTYGVVIFIVSFIDRLLHLFRITNKFKRNEREFLFLFVILIASAYLMYQSLVDSKFERQEDAIMYALLFTCVSWILWIYVKVRTPDYNNFSTLGGQIP